MEIELDIEGINHFSIESPCPSLRHQKNLTVERRTGSLFFHSENFDISSSSFNFHVLFFFSFPCIYFLPFLLEIKSTIQNYIILFFSQRNEKKLEQTSSFSQSHNSPMGNSRLIIVKQNPSMHGHCSRRRRLPSF